MRLLLIAAALLASVAVAGCAATQPPVPAQQTEAARPATDYYGTLSPHAADAVYFVLTDRFVDGDPSNNYPAQGGGAETGTFDRPIRLDGEPPANIGYLGGDFKGVLDHAAYIADTGFSALWITPIVDNPDEAFTGGRRPGEGGFTDRGKAGYHGYWGVNFYTVDEHLVSPGLGFPEFAAGLERHGISLVLDVVCNHGSPAYTMPVDQPKFGEIYGRDGRLLADHQNLHPTELDPDNPLHAYYNREPDLAELADMDGSNPDVLEYFTGAYLQWIEQGAAAFRIDTIKHMPHGYWKAFADRIRAEHPGFFMFAESFSYDAREIAEHTYPENGGISVLDFPGQRAMTGVFADGAPYSALADYLHLESGVYENPYDLMTFYDNHDMARMDADEAGFIDAHNWLFTSRGTPVIYYGSEIGFRAGTREHAGNRDYFGADNVRLAADHPIRRNLKRIATVRRDSVALQRGLQVNLRFGEDTAAFYRVYRRGDDEQTALVLLNKGDAPSTFDAGDWLAGLEWQDAMTGAGIEAASAVEVEPHGVRVLLLDGIPDAAGLRGRLDELKRRARR